MQPTKIEGMLQDDLDHGLSALEQAAVSLPDFTMAALLRRWTKQLRLATEKAPTDENVSAFMDCTIPWRSGEEVPISAKTPTARSLMTKTEGQSSVFSWTTLAGRLSYYRFSGELMDKPASANIASISECG